MSNSRKVKVAPISVIIPCYNCEYTIERALQSIENQSLQPKEIIVVNDGSNYLSCKKIQDICSARKVSSPKIVYVHLKDNYGPGYARNSGWQMTDCEYIAFLDSDDTWHPRKLEIQYNWMKSRPDIIITGHQSPVIPHDCKLTDIELPIKWDAKPVTRITQLISNRFPTRSVMIKNVIPFRFNTNRSNSEDYELWLEIVLSNFAAWRLELPLAFTYKAQYGASGLSGRLWQMEKKEIASYFEMYHKRLIPSLFFICLLPLSLVKYVKRVIISNLNIQKNP